MLPLRKLTAGYFNVVFENTRRKDKSVFFIELIGLVFNHIYGPLLFAEDEAFGEERVH
jgi:hypothetical protein